MLADHRIRIMNEVVSGIRIIKMYAWEIPFSAVVTAVRRSANSLHALQLFDNFNLPYFFFLVILCWVILS